MTSVYTAGGICTWAPAMATAATDTPPTTNWQPATRGLESNTKMGKHPCPSSRPCGGLATGLYASGGAGRRCSREHLCQRRFCFGEPEGHLHSTVHLDGRGECDVGLLHLASRGIQHTDAAVAVRLEWTHAELL